MVEKTHTISCVICTVDLPLPTSVAPSGSNLSTTFDETYIDEHMRMHENCSCEWSGPTRTPDTDCVIHAMGL